MVVGRGSLNVVLIILQVVTNIYALRLLSCRDYRSRVFSKQSYDDLPLGALLVQQQSYRQVDQGAEGVALVVKCLPILCGNLGLIASIAQARCGGAHL